MTNPQPTPSRNLKTIKLLTFLMFTMFAMTTDSVGPIINKVMNQFDLSKLAAGALHYCTMAAIALSGIFLGFLADKLGRKKTIILGLVLFALNSYLFVVGNDFIYFLSLLAISGIAIGIFKTGSLALIGDITTSTSEHTKIMNTLEGFFGVGAIIGPAIVSWLLSKDYSWKYLYVFAGGICTVLIIIAMMVNYPQTAKPTGEPIDFKRTMGMMKNPYALGFSLAIFFYVAAECAVYVWMPTLLGTPSFSSDDVKNLPALVERVKKTESARPIDAWVASKMSEKTAEAIANNKEKVLKKSLLDDINALVKGKESVYDASRFAGVTLRDETKKLMDEKPEGGDLTRLNRLLIEDAYAAEFSRNPLLTTKFGYMAMLYALSTFFILRVIGRFMGAWILARFDWTRVMAIFSLAIMLCFGGSVAGGLNYAVCLLPLSGLFMSMIYPTLNSKGISCFHKSEHGAVSGVILFFTCTAAALGPLAMGYASDLFKHAKYGFVLATVFTACLFGCMLINMIMNPAKTRLAMLDASEYEASK